MDARQVRTKEDAKCIVEERGLSHVKLGLTDIDGIMRGKYVSREKFFSILEKGMSFCDVVLGWDSNDQLYDNVTYTGWHTAYPDAPVRIVPESCRDLPVEGDMLFFLAEFDKQAEAICPRGLLRRVLKRASALGYAVESAVEFEFFVFEETPRSVREKGYRDLKPITPGYFGYSVLRSSVHADFYAELLRQCDQMGIPIEGLHTETGPGVLEAAIMHSPALEAADRAVLFKTFTKVLAQKRGWMASFMAKWSPSWPGQSGHLHMSLFDKRGKGVFHDAKKPHAMSDMMRWFVGGQQALMPELLAMVASTVNSYRRLIPGFWAPTEASWGIENRTCALRVIPGSASSQRVRVPNRGRRHQPLRRARRGDRLGALRHREQDRAGRARRRQRLCAEISEEARLAAHIDGCGRAAQAIESSAGAFWRCFRRPLCRDARMGGARVPPRHHGLGACPVFRDHLIARAVTPTMV